MEPKVILLAHTPEPEKTCAMAARLCYSSATIPELSEDFTPEEVQKFLAKLVELGHFSAIEHAVFTFGVEGISRACSHQFVRHRIASFSQKSQRYVTETGEPVFITPPSIKEAGAAIEQAFIHDMKYAWERYAVYIEAGIPAEDARFLLPNACETKLVVSMNARELYHLFDKRCCNRAQWEMREVAIQMLQQAKAVAPVLFANTGPSCVYGKCKEGKMTCGNPPDERVR